MIQGNKQITNMYLIPERNDLYYVSKSPFTPCSPLHVMNAVLILASDSYAVLKGDISLHEYHEGTCRLYILVHFLLNTGLPNPIHFPYS